MNSALLKYVMSRNGDGAKDLALYLGISETWLSQKINENGAEFRLSEIKKIIRRYKLTAEEVLKIFFADYVS